MSLRQKIILGFAVVGVFFVGLSLLAAYEVLRMERTIVVEEAVASLVDAVAEVRRFEKNYLLYAGEADLAANRVHSERAVRLLEENAGALAVAGRVAWSERLADGLAEYRQRMRDLAARPGDEAAEAAVRASGKELSAVAQQLAGQRLDALHAAMAGHRRTVFWVIGGSLAVLACVGTLLTLSVTRPLAALQRRLQAIAEGEAGLARIDLPSGDAEVRSLAAAFNRLMGELEEHQQQMLVSQKLASLGVLLSGVAHELNNPLSNIWGSCQILAEEGADGPIDPELARTHLGRIDEQVERARRIVASLLDLSRHQRFMKRPVPLAPAVADCVALLRGQLPAGVAVEVEVPEDLAVPADRQRLQQVLLNLVKNAADACGASGRVAIRARAEAHQVLLAVEDDGAGIRPEDLPHVFDPFYTTKEVGQGAGLGLFIVHDIVKKHGGAIQVDSGPGRGTSFLITLPVGDDTDNCVA